MAILTILADYRRQLLVAAVLMWLATPPRALTDEYALMAVYTYNFAKFTQWPAGSFDTPNASLRLCVLGEDPFGITLAKIENKKVRGHPLQIRRYSRVAVVDSCHILFVSRSERWRLDSVLQNVANLPILTISDIPDFSQQGGMITLAVVNRRIQFMINLASVVQARLRLSSKLLELAHIIDD